MSQIYELSRRRGQTGERSHIFEALRRAERADTLAEARGLPIAHVRGVASFYEQLHGLGTGLCVGTACWLSDGAGPARAGIHCQGRCFAPHSDESAKIPRFCLMGEGAIVLRHLLDETRDVFADYELPDGDMILEAVELSGLRGRGGAAYPTGAKWRAAKETPAQQRVVVANGDEGDPGAYIDRLIMEEAPHSLLAGMFACARAVGAQLGIVFVRGEYPNSAACLERAIEEARAHGVFGSDFDVQVIRGAGSYVAGEETALLAAIEGLRAEPHPKPPYPTQKGLWGLPTIVQNVETLSMIPWVVAHEQKPHTKAFCLSGKIQRPGIYEAPFGTTLNQLIAAAGGAPEGLTLKLALVGGPMGRVLPFSLFDTPLDYETLPGLGHGGIVVMDARVSARALFEHLAAFGASESCGKCTPCRVGTSKLTELKDKESLGRLFDTLEAGSLCGFGQGVPRPLRDLLDHFGSEVLP